MNHPIPALTLTNLQGVLGDVMRAAASWGMADAKGEPTDQHIAIVMQCVAQAMALVMQETPTSDQVLGVLGV